MDFLYASDQENVEVPGSGWTNGSIPPSMFAVTRDGIAAQYESQRRWMSLNTSWTRIGSGNPNDKRHRNSFTGKSITSDRVDEVKAVKCLISQLCEFFYKQGWATGTGGGCSIRIGGPSENRPWRVFVAPSGIQKEDMIGNDIFELDMDQNIVQKPLTEGLKLSACTPLWYIVYKYRPNTRCVIHTHSMDAQMATLLDPSEKSDIFRITHLEMLKGVGGHAYDDILEVPIIDNRPTEDELAEQLETVIQKYPKTNAVLVRRHGIYCWGDSWEQAKTQCESFDYLFKSAITMRQMGVDFEAIPSVGTYRTAKPGTISTEFDQPQSKKRKVVKVSEKSTAVCGFNGMAHANNRVDFVRNSLDIPLLPADSQILLLDIEGCTTSISFVKDTLFPYVLSNIESFVKSISEEQTLRYLNALRADVDTLSDSFLQSKCRREITTSEIPEMELVAYVRSMVANDIKATGLKSLQGHMWKSGYDSGELKGHIYSDFVPLLKWCKERNVKVCIYSSGSINAQKLLFQNTPDGDLTPYLSSYFDTTSGGKKEAQSYRVIASKMAVKTEDIVFVSDAEAELVAARDAGIGHTVMSIRPGNTPLSDVGKSFPKVYSLLQLCGSFD